jgi:hypothetical protein
VEIGDWGSPASAALLTQWSGEDWMEEEGGDLARRSPALAEQHRLTMTRQVNKDWPVNHWFGPTWKCLSAAFPAAPLALFF